MSKPLVLFLSLHDWANSTYEAVQAINSVGRIEARHVVFSKHPWDYPHDIMIDAVGKPEKQWDHHTVDEIVDLFVKADVIHLWNCEFSDFYNQGIHGRMFYSPIRIPIKKVKSCTYAGSQYRNNHAILNRRLTSMGIKVVVEDACFQWPGEVSTFIPHAINTDKIKYSPIENRIKNSVGVYNPNGLYDADIAMLKVACDRLNRFRPMEPDPPLKVVMNYAHPIPWKENLADMAKCWFFFQSPNDAANPWKEGWFGRSALEASAMGIPTLSFVSDKAKWHGEVGGLLHGELAIVEVTPNTLENTLNDMTCGHRSVSLPCRKWVIDHYGYNTIGNMYSDFFEQNILEGETSMRSAAIT